MDISGLYSSGIIHKGEEVVDFTQGTFNTTAGGLIILTNKRLIHVMKAGFFAKGYDLKYSCSLGDILSVSIVGLISKRANITIKKNDKLSMFTIYCKNSEDFAKRILGAKEGFVEDKIIDAKRVIIEEGNKDSADDILKKKLARGEIDLEEFHQKIQRT